MKLATVKKFRRCGKVSNSQDGRFRKDYTQSRERNSTTALARTKSVKDALLKHILKCSFKIRVPRTGGHLSEYECFSPERLCCCLFVHEDKYASCK